MLFYVQLRSQSSNRDANPDLPLRLSTTSDWQQKHSKIWDIVQELVVLNVFPTPQNPFSLDFDALRYLPLIEGVALQGALIVFFREFIVLKPKCSFVSSMSSELERLIAIHHECLSIVTNPTT